MILWMRGFCTFDKKTKSLTFVFVENATNEYHENGAITKYIIIPPYFCYLIFDLPVSFFSLQCNVSVTSCYKFLTPRRKWLHT